jgi:hypothetical protein
MDNEELEFDDSELALSSFVIDCADVLAAIISREFPDVEIGLVFNGPALWRPQRKIVVPHDSDYDIEQIDELAHETSMRIFWTHGVLISYVIMKEEDEID